MSLSHLSELETLSSDDLRQQYLRALRRYGGKILPASRSLGISPGSRARWCVDCPGFAREEQLVLDDCEVARMLDRAEIVDVSGAKVTRPWHATVIEMRSQGCTYAEIARRVGKSRERVRQLCKGEKR